MLSKRILVLMFVVAFLFVGCFPSVTPPVTENQAPTITSTAITTATVGVAYTYDVNATDPDGDTLTYSLDLKPSGMTIDPANGLIKWTPTAKGDHPVVVKVSDGSLSITQSFTIKVSTFPAVNQAPVIISTPITTATVGLTYFYGVNATDPNNDTLTYSLTACPPGMAISSANGLIMWNPTAKGNYAVVVNVSDGALSDTQGFTITVSKPTPTPINQAPVITSIPDDTATVGTEYIYEVKATDPDGDILVYSLTTKPMGMTISSATGLIKWTPNVTQVGDNSVTVKVSDGTLSDTESFEITVDVKVVETVTIRWLENAVRFYPDGSTEATWQNDPTPALKPGVLTKNPATLIHIDGEYHFADVNEYYNNAGITFEGSVVIDGIGQLSGHTTYTLYDLDTTNDFIGQVVIIIGEEINWDEVDPLDLSEVEGEEIPEDYDGIMVGTYTQWKYVYGTEEEVIDSDKYPNAVPAPEQGSDWWFVGKTIYTAHGGK